MKKYMYECRNRRVGLATIAALLSLAFSGVAGEKLASASDGFRASEWGTFTTLHHPSGRPLKWYQSPQGRSSELPSFVNGSLLTKVNPYYFARMETPVIYFYSEDRKVVDVNATYPDGKITEYYPGFGRGYRAWQKLEIIPAEEARADGLDERFPLDPKKPDNHYFEARNVPDAAVVRLTRDGDLKTQHETDQYERFLFYRGAGNFHSYLTPLFVEDDKMLLWNSSSDMDYPHVWVLQSSEGAIRWQKLPIMKSGGVRTEVKFNELDRRASREESIAELTQSMVAALVDSGLSTQEAAAMVATWDSHWYEEPGHRLLSIVPQKYIDQILPLEISPKPESVERVFVHRTEILSPKLMETLKQAMAADTKADNAAEIVARAGLGRFGFGAIEAASEDVGNDTTAAYRGRGMAALRAASALKQKPAATPEKKE